MDCEDDFNTEPTIEELRKAESMANRLTGDAIEILNRHWRAYYDSINHSHTYTQHPRRAYVGRDLYEMYEQMLPSTQRFYRLGSDVDVFNGGLVYRNLVLLIEGDGWGVRFE